VSSGCGKDKDKAIFAREIKGDDIHLVAEPTWAVVDSWDDIVLSYGNGGADGSAASSGELRYGSVLYMEVAGKESACR